MSDLHGRRGSDHRPPSDERHGGGVLGETWMAGKSLSRRARQTQRTLEQYVSGAVMPRYMERLREIEDEIVVQRRALARAYDRVRAEAAGDLERFRERWHATALGWRFDALNQLIDDHNEHYPIEARLRLDPRTGDYVRRAGRSYRREPLDARWILEQFPA